MNHTCDNCGHEFDLRIIPDSPALAASRSAPEEPATYYVQVRACPECRQPLDPREIDRLEQPALERDRDAKYWQQYMGSQPAP